MAKIICVLYPDPVTGYPPRYARDDIPEITAYPNGQTAPTPQGELGFSPGELIGCVSGELGLRAWAEANGHELIVTSDKDGTDSVLDRHLGDADVVISQPFWPAYLTAERLAKAPRLKLALTAGIGSDHVDLKTAAEHGVTVAEVTFSNSISVAEHVMMTALTLVRNFVPSHQTAINGGWNIADCVSRSYDIEGLHFGTLGAGRIGLAVLKRMHPFDTPLHYYDPHRLPEDVERSLNLTYHDSPESLVSHCDIVNVQTPLYPSTKGFIDREFLSKFKRGAYLINTARGALCNREAIVEALESGQLAGYGGDVWFPQPAPVDHPWRRMPNHAMTPHISGTSLSAQTRYAAGTLEILQDFLEGTPLREEYLIVDAGTLAGAGANAYQL
ncbi:NAD-dependent formate dehydrogenase [Larsenimonas salina]|uniref:NAD-dependent formate dehydrogenase n=1 Tax=Larsenimonas salina TaxID=1295565 RepID=UPI0020742093|nr:NAD-dependent formate dehydrogenase [Larsenimonas salina]MCM5704392.1 NAD-dependent formate dehydrogenase [Larsenimonas salina]